MSGVVAERDPCGAVFRFHELLGPSQVNGDVDRDWVRLESVFGYTLPGDYKQFVSAYGPGCVNDQLSLFHPRAARGDGGLNLEDLWGRVAQAHDVLRRNHPDMYPYEVYPSKGGIYRLVDLSPEITSFSLRRPLAQGIGVFLWTWGNR
ncbi:hypothetical protein SSP531S_02710 [Streptomyces spongiicola]|uniref:Knr4/Smi1-like domain-containing protein n=1 Tax=Streptomyces spongiicola TaxID=1690221 RepID=A0A388SQP0_9ACTN|nr:hypothetical protein SSP531S_02710 [Streptomyces spongiicola]